jgi:hypothetical protein
MTRLLERWGMLADVRARGDVGTALVFHDGALSLSLSRGLRSAHTRLVVGDTAEVVGVQKLFSAAMEVFGAEFLVCQVRGLRTRRAEVLSADARLGSTRICTRF